MVRSSCDGRRRTRGRRCRIGHIQDGEGAIGQIGHIQIVPADEGGRGAVPDFRRRKHRRARWVRNIQDSDIVGCEICDIRIVPAYGDSIRVRADRRRREELESPADQVRNAPLHIQCGLRLRRADADAARR